MWWRERWRRVGVPGWPSVLGAALGNLGNAVGASLGLAALFAVSSVAFSVVKFAGAAYLVWLGVSALRRRDQALQRSGIRRQRLGRLLRDGFLVALLNPKTALFFAAFLPQFIDPTGSAVTQSLALSVVFVLLAAATDTAYVLGAGAAIRVRRPLEAGTVVRPLYHGGDLHRPGPLHRGGGIAKRALRPVRCASFAASAIPDSRRPAP